MKQVFLRGSVRELASTSVTQLLGAHQYARIVGDDPAPLFVSMVIAHEGESRGEIVGVGARVKEWTRKAVRAVVRAFRPSGRVPAVIFDGMVNWHGAESTRQPVGDVVHTRITELAGSNIEAAETIGYIYPDQLELREAIRRGERDCCSLEADVLMIQEGQRLVIDDVERGSAVVLGHSSRQMPGFPLARVQRLQEFEPAETPGSPNVGAVAGAAPAPTTPPVVPAAVTPAAPSATPTGGAIQPTPLSREQVLAEARRVGLSAADFSPAPPVVSPASLPAPTPAPPEQPTPAQTDNWDLTNPAINPFLP